MKRSFQIFSLLLGSLILFLIWSFQPAIAQLGRKNQMKNELSTLPIPYTARQDITFLLGQDKDGNNPYFKQANQYYRQHPEDQTEFVIDTCQSLLAVRNYLNDHTPSNGRPWGKINLVFHSNEWTGMGIPTLPGGKRTTEITLANAIGQGAFPPLNNNVVDACTEMVFHGCAFGRNEGLLAALRAAFIPSGVETQLSSSPYFVIFDRQQNGLPKRYLADYWYTFYRTGNRPADSQIVSQLERTYPDVQVDWERAVKRQQTGYGGGAFHYTFKVPIVWTVTYPSIADRPSISSWKDQRRWLDEQEEMQAIFEKYQIPESQFSWYIRYIDHEFEDGTKEPAIKAVGFCTVLCVLQEVQNPVASLVRF
ncbi:MAG: hypothetical protein HRU41_26440 [Saprospiraceae bacterium]|nr:hypothetical protein [Saprospiraceae bacterium]